MTFAGLRSLVRSRRSFVLFWLAVLALAILKMLIIWGNETVPEGSDSFLYMQYAKVDFWGSDHFPFRGPIYPLWISFSHAIGVPLRLTIEALFIIGAAAFSAALLAISFPLILSITVYAVILFYPDTFYVFDQPMTEGFFVCLALLAFACFIMLLKAAELLSAALWAGTFGLLVAFMLHTRGNDLALLAGMCAVALITFVAVAFLTPGHRPVLRSAIACVAGAVVFASVHLAVLTANYAAFGQFKSAEIVSGAQQELLHSMMRIDTGEPELHGFISVTNKAREIAYGLSPTLNKFRKVIEEDFRADQERSSYTSFSRTGVPGQFDTQATLMAFEGIRPTPPADGWPDIEEANARDKLLHQISGEIDAALAAGKAPSRPIIYVWNPFSKLLYMNASRSAARLVGEMFKAKSPPKLDNYPFYGSLASPLYNEMADRRLWAVQKGPLKGYVAVRQANELKGVSFHNDTPAFFASQGAEGYYDTALAELKKMGIRAYFDMGQAEFSAVTPEAVPAGWSLADPAVWNVYQFQIPPVDDRFHLDFGRLDIELGNQGLTSFHQLGLLKGMVSDDGGVQIYLTDFPLEFTPSQARGYAIQQWLFANFLDLAFIALIAIAVILVLAAWYLPSLILTESQSRIRLTSITVIAWAFIVSRVLFYSVMDVTIMPLNDSRHLFAANIFALPAVVLSLFVLSLFLAAARGAVQGAGLRKARI